ncbi:HD domain-containing protein [Clostridiaceae bacterium M8S5]|nr:HD domain-containing protein [Clostridiaceae bacterium M8S5]
MDNIAIIKNIVEDACKNDNNTFGYGIWSHHIVDVVDYSKILAKKLDANIEIVEIAALLHDYAGIKCLEYYDEHHKYGAIEAEKILKELNYNNEIIDQVKHCIFSHRASVMEMQMSKEAICVASADAMAHIKQVPSLLYCAYVQKGMNIDEGSTWVRDKIKRSWNKLCKEAKEVIIDDYNNAIKILQA